MARALVRALARALVLAMVLVPAQALGWPQACGTPRTQPRLAR